MPIDPADGGLGEEVEIDPDEDASPDAPLTAQIYRTALTISGQQATFASAILDVNDVYPLIVEQTADGNRSCFFRPPVWLQDPDPEYRVYIAKVHSFLRSFALWFGENKQAFLTDPTPEHFVAGEMFAGSIRNLQPIVTRAGLLARVIHDIEMQEGMRMDETQFGKLLPKLWLLGPDWNMPVENLFSEPCKVAWVQEGVGLNAKLSAPRETNWKTMRDRVKARSLENMTPIERLAVLCYSVRPLSESKVLAALAQPELEGPPAESVPPGNPSDLMEVADG